MARLPRVRRSFTDIRELQKEAESGDTEAQHALAGELAKGLSIKRDRTAALHWWMKASEGNEYMAGDALEGVVAEILATARKHSQHLALDRIQSRRPCLLVLCEGGHFFLWTFVLVFGSGF